jgi:hypothetical protein
MDKRSNNTLSFDKIIADDATIWRRRAAIAMLNMTVAALLAECSFPTEAEIVAPVG